MQLGFYFDQTRCTGCCTCMVACKDWNDIPAGPASWRRITSVEEGDALDPFLAYLTKGKGSANGRPVTDGDLVRGDTVSFAAFEDVQLIVVHLEN